MSKVYVVMDHFCDSDILLGVFSCREKADAYIAAEKKKDRFCFDGEEIYEVELDKPYYSPPEAQNTRL